MAIATNKTHVCYSFVELLEEGLISEMKVDTQRLVSPKKQLSIEL